VEARHGLRAAFPARGDDEQLLAFGPIVLEMMSGLVELAETTDCAGYTVKAIGLRI